MSEYSGSSIEGQDDTAQGVSRRSVLAGLGGAAALTATAATGLLTAPPGSAAGRFYAP